MSTFDVGVWGEIGVALYLVTFIGASVIFRLARGKPVFPGPESNAVFVEKWTSGGMGRNCLVVSLTRSELTISPLFPFNLMFLPEIWGMEHRVSLSEIQRVEHQRGFFRSAQVIHFKDGKRFSLRLRHPERLDRALANLRPQSLG